MPILPPDHPEPFAATLGVMLYPGVDGADRRKALAFAAQFFAEPLQRHSTAGRRLPYEALLQIAKGAGERLMDLDSRWHEGVPIQAGPERQPRRRKKKTTVNCSRPQGFVRACA